MFLTKNGTTVMMFNVLAIVFFFPVWITVVWYATSLAGGWEGMMHDNYIEIGPGIADYTLKIFFLLCLFAATFMICVLFIGALGVIIQTITDDKISFIVLDDDEDFFEIWLVTKYPKFAKALNEKHGHGMTAHNILTELNIDWDRYGYTKRNGHFKLRRLVKKNQKLLEFKLLL